MAVEQLKPGAEQTAGPTRSEQRFPSYSLADSVQVAKLIYDRGGGSASPEHLSTYLGYKGTNNGSYLARVGSARIFGLIGKNGTLFVPSPLAHRILSPVYPADAKQALVEAFFNIPLFKKIYEDFRGKELPPEFGMKNALRNTYGVVPGRVDVAYRALIDSAETAYFFETRMGARTHLILPAIQAPNPNPHNAPAAPAATPNTSGGNGGGNGTNVGEEKPTDRQPAQLGATLRANPNVAAQLTDVKAQYLATLIRLFEKKSEDGELDEKLMERIERLLGTP